MKLWLLKPREDLTEEINPWHPWYDKCFGMVIRAETEDKAREMATESGSDELRERKDAWTNPMYSSCAELVTDGDPEVIITDDRNA